MNPAIHGCGHPALLQNGYLELDGREEPIAVANSALGQLIDRLWCVAKKHMLLMTMNQKGSQQILFTSTANDFYLCSSDYTHMEPEKVNDFTHVQCFTLVTWLPSSIHESRYCSGIAECGSAPEENDNELIKNLDSQRRHGTLSQSWRWGRWQYGLRVNGSRRWRE